MNILTHSKKIHISLDIYHNIFILFLLKNKDSSPAIRCSHILSDSLFIL